MSPRAMEPPGRPLAPSADEEGRERNAAERENSLLATHKPKLGSAETRRAATRLNDVTCAKVSGVSSFGNSLR